MSNPTNTKVLCFRSDYSHMSSTSSKYGLNVLQFCLQSPPWGSVPSLYVEKAIHVTLALIERISEGILAKGCDTGFSGEWRKVETVPGECDCTLIWGLDVPLLSLWKFSLEELAQALLTRMLGKYLLWQSWGNSFIQQTCIQYLPSLGSQLRVHLLDHEGAPVPLLGRFPPVYFCTCRQIPQMMIIYG